MQEVSMPIELDEHEIPIPNVSNSWSSDSNPSQQTPHRSPLFFVQEENISSSNFESDKSDDFYSSDIDSDALKQLVKKARVEVLNDAPIPPSNIDVSLSDSNPVSNFFSLSALGLTNVMQLPVIDDFVFIVGGKEYHCNKFQASFISPVVTRLLISDINSSEFIIDLDDKENYFANIMSLLRGDIIQINDENSEFLLQVANILGNDEMIESFSSHIPQLHEGNAIDLYLRRLKYNLETTQEIKFIASNFGKINLESLLKLEPDQLASIIGSDLLTIKNEESFFETIIQYIEHKGNNAKFLLGYISLPDLSENLIPTFLEMISPESIDGMMWQTICDRLKLKVHSKKKKNSQKEKSKLFNGIIARLKTKYNIHKILQIKASSTKYDNLYVLTDRTAPDFFSSYNLPNSWVSFYFKNKKIKLEEYSLETANLPPGEGHLISWQVEASNDNKHWTVLDSQYSLILHKGHEKAKTFQCDKSDYFRYFRIKQCGLNDKGDDTMILKAVEFFGSVKSVSHDL